MRKTLRRLAAGLALAGMLVTSAFALTPQELGDLLREYYVDPIPERVWEEDTVEGMLSALGDPYTAYMPAREYDAFTGTMKDTKAVGLGVRGTWTDAGFLVDAAFPDSPAARAGIEADEVIVELDGEAPESAEALMEALAQLGDGGRCTLTVAGLDGTRREVEVTLGAYVYPTAFLVKQRDGVSYLNVNTFGETTYREVFDVLTDREVVTTTDAWVVDLRDDPGGNIFPAAYLPGMFLGDWDYVVQVTRNGVEGKACGDVASLPKVAESGLMEVPGEAQGAYNENGALVDDGAFVMALVNGQSASASELAATLFRRMGGVVIGERTYGKGVGQSLFNKSTHPEIFGDDALKVTSMKLYNTSGVTTHVLGVIPNLVVSAQMADEVAALLGSPLDEGESVTLDIPGDGGTVLISENAMKAAPEAAAELLRALTPFEQCRYRGRDMTPAELAQALGIPYESRWFTDVDGSLYGYELNTLAALGIVNGVGGGRYDPEATMDRASLAALVVKAIGPRQIWSLETSYPDVSPEDWYWKYVSAVHEAGWMEGDDLGQFRPDDTMTHQEFFTMLGRVAASLDYEVQMEMELLNTEDLRELYPGWADWSLKGAMIAQSRYAWADPGEIDPLAPVTREEAGKAIYDMLDHMNAI